MSWSEERVEQLKQLVADGNTAGQIAKELGVTRNTVIGKIHRLKLVSGRFTRINSTRMVRPPAIRIQGSKVRLRPRLDLRGVKAALIKINRIHFKKSTKIESPSQCTLLELNKHTCRWPLWGEEAKVRRFYCGEQTLYGSSYCANHACVSIGFRHAGTNVEPAPVLTAVSTPLNSP